MSAERKDRYEVGKIGLATGYGAYYVRNMMTGAMVREYIGLYEARQTCDRLNAEAEKGEPA